MTDPTGHTTILDAKGIAKRFGSVVALRDASLQVRRGQVVALMGANGAGKSTFVKILTGALKADSGHVRIKGRESLVGSPAAARRSGLVPVYQEPSLIPDLDVTPHTHPYLDALVARGELGMKSGKGFRSWTPETAEAVRERLRSFLAHSARARAGGEQS